MNYQDLRRVAIIGGIRIPFCRAHTAYAEQSNQDMMTAVLANLVDRFELKGQRLGDVSLGAVLKHARDWNLARECVLGSGLAPETPAFDIQRALDARSRQYAARHHARPGPALRNRRIAVRRNYR